MELKSMLLHLWMIAFGFFIFSQGSKCSTVASFVTTATPASTIQTADTTTTTTSILSTVSTAATTATTTNTETTQAEASRSSKEIVKSTILRSNTINDKTFLRTQSKRGLSASQLAAEAKSLTLIPAATTEITKANGNSKTVNTSLSIATKGSFNTTANKEQDIISDQPAATTIAPTIAGRAQAITIAAKLLATSTPIDDSELFDAASHNFRISTHNNDKANNSSSGSGSNNNAINNNNNNNMNNAASYFHLKQQRTKFNNQGQNSDPTNMMMAAKAEALVATTTTTITAGAAAAAASATAAFVPVNNIMLATAAAESNHIMSNSRDIEENELSVVFNRNNIKTNLATTTAAATATTTTTVTVASESPIVSSTPLTTTTTTIRTTRRPIPTTTLKPPPTIDDYQTIVSQAGTHAYLPCNVKQLVKKPISWLRVRDGHILTVDQTTFIADQRFQSIFSSNPERWSLQIKYVQLKDEGTYECQVSTEPKASAIVHLRIVEPKTELIGESTRHVKAGSQVKLRCIISQALEPPLFINWFYNQKQIYLHNRRGWRTEIERIDLPLPTTEAPTTQPTTSTATSATGNAALTTRPDSLDDAGLAAVTSLPTTAHTISTAALTTATAVGGSTGDATAGAAAGAAATSAPMMIGSTLVTTLSALYPTMTTAITTTTTTTTTTTAMPTTTTTTTTTTQSPTTTTTMLPSSAFIKQMTIASLVIPSVVKSDSGNYTCSPSNSATRTIVLHVLNGEYSASAITSASVSWNPIIGSRGQQRYFQQCCNVATILSLLWLIKFLFARNIANFQRGRNKAANNCASLFYCRRRRRLQQEQRSHLAATSLPLDDSASAAPQVSTTKGKRPKCTNNGNTNANANNNNNNKSTTTMPLICIRDNKTRPMTTEHNLKQRATASNNNVDNIINNERQQLGRVLRRISDSSISGVTTKVAEDKT